VVINNVCSMKLGGWLEGSLAGCVSVAMPDFRISRIYESNKVF